MSAPAAREAFGPRAGSDWNAPGTVAGFSVAPPNPFLMRFAEGERWRVQHPRALDLGCGAGRNAVPLARLGWEVIGIDLSRAMLDAAGQRARAEALPGRLRLALAPMDRIPARDRSFDLVIAHGIWNLARTTAEFCRAIREAARVSRPGAGLFVFTFSRETFPPGTQPVAGEPFVFTEFSGQPQCFVTAEQLVSELGAAGFTPDPSVPLRRHNLPRPGTLHVGPIPVIYEGTFRYQG